MTETAPITAREALEEAIEFAEQDYPTYSGSLMVERWRKALAALSVQPARDSGIDTLAAERMEQFLQAEINRAPEPMRRLGEYLTNVLDADQWRTAERMLNAAVLATNAVQPAREGLEAAHFVDRLADEWTGDDKAKGLIQFVARALHDRAALSAAPAPVETGWQDIASAPTDRVILVWPSIWSDRKWDEARFDDDRYAKNPRPFWRRSLPAFLRQCRENVPLMWFDPPAPSTGEG